jgi:transcriptional regulator with PAS, ATPase and Fis domain
VLLTGYTGSGKELAARFLHRQSGRKGPFAAVNAAAIPEHLAESELFGHVKGAFTGADRDQTGIFEYGNRGTVFLDEIGELPLNLQAKLLRVLETRQVRRLGSPRPVDLDIRVIAATNRNLREEVREKRFREDLYYRLSAAEVRIPTLRERMEDLPLLERLFIERFRRDHTSQLAGITPRAQLILSAHQWPGNIRELENVIAYACLHASGMMIDSADLPETLNRPPLSPLDSIDEVVRKYVESVVERMGGSKTRAAEALGIDRATVYRLLNKPK